MVSLPCVIENSQDMVSSTKGDSVNLKIEENSLRSRLKDTELTINHEIQQLNQLNYNFEYLKGTFVKNSRNLDEDNRILENSIHYLTKEIDELKALVDYTTKRLDRFEQKKKNSIKKA